MCVDCPVEQVTWYTAVAFANVVSRLEGLPVCYQLEGCENRPGEDLECNSATLRPDCLGYRLPTEAEWEYAARAGTTEARYAEPLAEIGWYLDNSEYETHPVASKRPNAWGLYDMLGNVWEQTEDWYGSYPDEAQSDPLGPAGGTGRVSRGGAAWFSTVFCRSAVRVKSAPSNRGDTTGFRLARPAPSPTR